MENKDDREIINCQEPIMEDEAAGPATAPANVKILVKLRLPKMPEEVEEELPPPAPPQISAAEETIKSHYCKECNKSFGSGKALGGHMSSAHVQANKDYSYKKLNSKMKRPHKSSGPAADNTCRQCGKAFLSKKSLFGHMRCHPERDWRGMEPPAKTKIDSPEASSEPEYGQNQESYEEDDDDQIDSGSGQKANAGCKLKGWPTKTKRGRGLMNTSIRADVSSSEEKEAVIAGRQLIRLLNSESGKQKVGISNTLARHGPEFDQFKKRKLDSGVKIDEREAAIDGAVDLRREMESNGKGKANENSDTGSTMSLPADIDSDDEHYLMAVEVLMNGKRNQIENQKRVKVEKIDKAGDSGKSSPEKYKCNICNRSFPTHQALGGHRSSHNKFKMSIINTADRRANAAKEKGKSKEANAKIVAGTVGDDNVESAEKVVLDFDLNMTPEEEKDKDADGDTSNHTSNS